MKRKLRSWRDPDYEGRRAYQRVDSGINPHSSDLSDVASTSSSISLASTVVSSVASLAEVAGIVTVNPALTAIASTVLAVSTVVQDIASTVSTISSTHQGLVEVLANNSLDASPNNNLMSNPLFVSKYAMKSNKKWPKNTSGLFKCDHSWQAYHTADVGKQQHVIMYIGDAGYNYSKTTGDLTHESLIPAFNFFDLNPNETITGSTVFISHTDPSSDRICAIKSKGYIDMSNCTNVGLFFSIAYYRCKQATDKGVLEVQQEYKLSEALNIATIVAPVLSAGTKGSSNYYDVAVPAANIYQSVASSYAGMNPNSTKESQKVWDLIDRQEGYLPGSAIVRHYQDIHFNHTRSRHEAGTTRYLKGSVVAILSYHGEAALAVGEEGKYMSHSKCAIGMIGFQQLSFTTVEHNNKAAPILSNIHDNAFVRNQVAFTQENSANIAIL